MLRSFWFLRASILVVFCTSCFVVQFLHALCFMVSSCFTLRGSLCFALGGFFVVRGSCFVVYLVLRSSYASWFFVLRSWWFFRASWFIWCFVLHSGFSFF